MSKLGISISIDVTKIDKTRMVKGSTGNKYLNLTTFINTEEPDKNGRHGLVKQETTKEERAGGLDLGILGNAKVFWVDESLKSSNTAPKKDTGSSSGQSSAEDFDDEIPF